MASTIENSRMSQLPAITAAEIATSDLSIVDQLSTGLTKRIDMGELRNYATNYVYSGSGGLVPSASMATTSSYSITSVNSISASYALSSSYSPTAVSSSYAGTASIALNAGGSGTTLTTGSLYPISASNAITSSNALWAGQSLFLAYNGNTNGTASYALTSSYSSVLNAVSAAYATNALAAATATLAATANNLSGKYMAYSPLVAVVGTTQDTTESYVAVDIKPSDNSAKPTVVMATGTIIVPFTGSVIDAGRYLWLAHRLDGVDTELDRAYFSRNDSDAATSTGSVYMNFHLMSGEVNMTGSYRLFVSCSMEVDQRLAIDSNRAVRFKVESQSDNVT